MDRPAARPAQAHSAPPRTDTLPRARLDDIYRDIADYTGLRHAATADLIDKRQFPEATDGAHGLYFSLPRDGEEERRMTAWLVDRHGAGTLARVPGFTRGPRGLRFRSVAPDRDDYAVMGLDADGLAFWGYSRRLPFDPARDGAKYMLLSSGRPGEASLAGTPKYHVAGMQYPADEVGFTEGVTKAEIISTRLGMRVIGLYSTSVDGPTLQEIAGLATAWQTKTFTLAFDADKNERNDDGSYVRLGVLAGEKKLAEALRPLGTVASLEWDWADGKGADDMLTAGGAYRREAYFPPTFSQGAPLAGTGKRREVLGDAALRGRLAGTLEGLYGYAEKARDLRDCGAAYGVSKCSACGVNPATPYHCGFTLCPTCLGRAIASDLRHHAEALPERWTLLTLVPRDAEAGSGRLKRARTSFVAWRKYHKVAAGFSGLLLSRAHGVVGILAIPAGDPVPASTRTWAVEVAAEGVSQERLADWWIQQYVAEAGDWDEREELVDILTEAKGRKRFQGFGVFHRWAPATAVGEEATVETVKLGRISGGSGKAEKHGPNHDCPRCGGVGTVPPAKFRVAAGNPGLTHLPGGACLYTPRR